MSDYTPNQNDRLRAHMERTMRTSADLRSRKDLALAIGIAPATLSNFLNRKHGASPETAEGYAAHVARLPLAEIIGPRYERGQRANVRPLVRSPAKYAVTDPEVRRKAIVFLQQPPHPFDLEAIQIAEELVGFDTKEEASNPAFVAEAWRKTISGSAASAPSSHNPESPRRTRRSRPRV